MGHLGIGWLGYSWLGLSNSQVYSINAGGTVAEAKSASINAQANVAEAKTYSINAGGNVGYLRNYTIDVGGRVIGYVVYSINAGGLVAEVKSGSINVGGNVGELKSGSINAGGKVSELRNYSIDAGGRVIGYQFYSINAQATIAEARSASINASGTVSQLRSTTLLAIGKVSEPKTNSINAGGHVSTRFLHSINAGGAVTLAQQHYIYASGLVIARPYYSLNSVDITNEMLEGLKSSGPDMKVEKLAFPGQRRSKLIDGGSGPLEYEFDAYFSNQEAAFDYVHNIQLDSGDGRFYPGDSLWYHKIKFIETQRTKRRQNRFFVGTRVHFEKSDLYCNEVQEWTSGSITLPRTSGNFVNNGHYDTALDLLRITGHYSAGRPKYLVYTIMDGVNALDTINLCDQLLSEEQIELDEDGLLTSTYSDDYASGTIFGQDATASNAAVSGGKVTVGVSGYYYYDFLGPWPLIDSMELVATLHIVQGSPYIEYSIDGGATYITAVTASQMRDNVETTYYIPAAGYKDVRVRFRCGAADILDVLGVSFTAVRRTRGTATPKIASGSTRQIKISDGTGSTHSVSIYARYRDMRRQI